MPSDNAIQAVLEKEAEDLQIELQELERVMGEWKKLFHVRCSTSVFPEWNQM